MKKKILMLIMCGVLSCSGFAGCAGDDSGEIITPAELDVEEVEEEEEEEEETPVVEEEEVTDTEESEPVEEVGENTMPRSDAYDLFLAGEMDVTVLDDNDDYTVPAPGTYSYEELRDAAIADLNWGMGGEYDVKYALFTPDSGQEGDDVLVMLVENHDPSFLNWIGFIGYNNGKLELNYYTEFGYRSYFDLYYTGDILSGGSGGAGAHYQDYQVVNPDATVDTVYTSAYLYAMWCSDVFYMVDPEYDYNSIPALDDASELEMTAVTNYDTVYICVNNWSDVKSLKEQEEAYVQALQEIGVIVVDADKMASLTENNVDESKTMTWNDIESITVEAEEEDE